jgi:hypothetical protein
LNRSYWQIIKSSTDFSSIHVFIPPPHYYHQTRQSPRDFFFSQRLRGEGGEGGEIGMLAYERQVYNQPTCLALRSVEASCI